MKNNGDRDGSNKNRYHVGKRASRLDRFSGQGRRFLKQVSRNPLRRDPAQEETEGMRRFSHSCVISRLSITIPNEWIISNLSTEK